MNVREFLREQHVPFDVLPHRTTFSAQRMAQVLDVPGDNVAKTVVLKADGRCVVAVLQATHEVDLGQAREALGAGRVELAHEDELQGLFPDCELGAVPPFGSRYGLGTLVDKLLTEDDSIVFEGNRHNEAVTMHYADYERIEHPQVAAFSRHA